MLVDYSTSSFLERMTSGVFGGEQTVSLKQRQPLSVENLSRPFKVSDDRLDLLSYIEVKSSVKIIHSISCLTEPQHRVSICVEIPPTSHDPIESQESEETSRLKFISD